jgi:hypothetical protein
MPVSTRAKDKQGEHAGEKRKREPPSKSAGEANVSVTKVEETGEDEAEDGIADKEEEAREEDVNDGHKGKKEEEDEGENAHGAELTPRAPDQIRQDLLPARLALVR